MTSDRSEAARAAQLSVQAGHDRLVAKARSTQCISTVQRRIHRTAAIVALRKGTQPKFATIIKELAVTTGLTFRT